MPRPPQYSEEELLDEIRRLADDVGRSPPRKRDMDEYGNHASRTYTYRFGSWSDAVREAGFEPRDKPNGMRERPERCPLCSEASSGLDFHHWRYGENEAGCYLCRSCHDAVHEDGANPEQNPDWLVEAVKNIIVHHADHHDSAVTRKIKQRYNIPSQDIVEYAISKTDVEGEYA